MTRLLGIDLGTRRIGVAIADTESGEVRPLAVLRRTTTAERDAERVARLVEEQRVDEVIVGLPLNMDGSEGFQAAETREWGAAVAALVAVPLGWRDERLTSEIAEVRAGVAARRGRSGGAPSPAARNAHRARIDREAAANILQAELDARAAEARR